MTSPEQQQDPHVDALPAEPASADLESWARLQIEQAEQADGAERLRILDELHEVLESNLAEGEAGHAATRQ